MCQAITHSCHGARQKIYFTEHAARLPLQTRHGETHWVSWGRRLHEAGELPVGGTLLRSALDTAPWQALFPRPVKVLADGFLLRDLEDRVRYYPLVKDQLLQGVWVRQAAETRVYVLMQALQEANALHLQWPRVVCQNRSATAQLV